MKKLVGVVLFVLYLTVWGLLENKARWADYYLSPAPSAPLLKVVSGYGRQMAGFSLFVKVAVFSGGMQRGVEKLSYADNLAQNFEVMTDLYPKFGDAYHYCQSLLATIAPEYARRANDILERGVEARPDVLYFRFFQAFNHYYYLQDPAKAGELFFELSSHPDAPPWFGHLAGSLMAKGGNLLAGRAMLQAMFESEKEEIMKERYRRSIMNFDWALQVQAAMDLYRKEHGRDPASLEDLVPSYLDALPKMGEGFKLVWEPPLLRLERP